MRSHRLHVKLSLAALCALLTLPFLNPHHFNPIPSFFQEGTAALFGLLAATLLFRRERLARLAVPEMALLPLGLLALLLIQFAFGLVVFTTQALIFALYLLWAILIMTLARSLRQVLRLERLADLLATAVLYGALIAALQLALQLINPAWGLGWILPIARGGGNLGQPNHLANYLWLGMASLIYLRTRERIGVVKVGVYALTLLSAASLTGSRSVLLYALGFALLSVWAAWHFREKPLSDIARLSLLILPATILLQFVFAHLDLASQLQTSVSGERLFQSVSGTSQRLQLWRTGLAIFLEHPWLGAGIGQFPVNSYLIVGAAPDGRFIGGGEHAHNLLVHLLAEFGPLAPILLLVLGVRWWMSFVRQPWSAAHWWIAAILLVLSVHSQLEYPLWYCFFLGIAALVLGLGSRDELRPQVSSSGRLLLALILVLGGVTLATMAYDYHKLEKTLNARLVASDDKHPWQKTLQSLSELRQGSLFSHYVDMSYAYQLSIDRESLKDKITVTEMAIRFSPVDLICFKLAYLLALDGKPEAAHLALQRAVATHPAYKPIALKQLGALVERYPELASLLDELKGMRTTADQ